MRRPTDEWTARRLVRWLASSIRKGLFLGQRKKERDSKKNGRLGGGWARPPIEGSDKTIFQIDINGHFSCGK